MNAIFIPLKDVKEEHRSLVGDKSAALARACRAGFSVPEAFCVTTQAFKTFMEENDLRSMIHMELARKRFEDMRWEELWDAALRIRNKFISAPLPHAVEDAIHEAVAKMFGDAPVVVRSSAPGEDSAETSFAGIHESYVNVRGAAAIGDHVKLVWSTLFSDKALLYRKELGLDVQRSAMAVIVQRLASGSRSGIAFSVDPTDNEKSVIEAVYGLNQGLVDGLVEPDRWHLDRASGSIEQKNIAEHRKQLAPSEDGIVEQELPKDKVNAPVLEDSDVASVYELAIKAEKSFGAPQDVEWTFEGDELFALQSRPITTGAKQEDDPRRWYLSLHRSLEQLEALHRDIESRVLPGMEADAARFAHERLSDLDDKGLAGAIEQRVICFERWKNEYWDICIPFAHGMRLFGSYYNEVVRPDDPYEFVDIISSSNLESIERNRHLEALAALLEGDEQDASFEAACRQFIQKHGAIVFGTRNEEVAQPKLVELVRKIKQGPRLEPQSVKRTKENLEEQFFSAVPPHKKRFAQRLLKIGRASYRLRDDDNLYLDAVEYEAERALKEAEVRLRQQGRAPEGRLDDDEVVKALRDKSYQPQASANEKSKSSEPGLRARQLIGQPAGKGVVQGKARLVTQSADVFLIEPGEIIVCDAIDPSMTLGVSLATGIVEERGGMLIHGAIIAREYGLPCITGIPQATSYIKTGDVITVDGDLGIVTIHTEQREQS